MNPRPYPTCSTSLKFRNVQMDDAELTLPEINVWENLMEKFTWTITCCQKYVWICCGTQLKLFQYCFVKIMYRKFLNIRLYSREIVFILVWGSWIYSGFREARILGHEPTAAGRALSDRNSFEPANNKFKCSRPNVNE